MICWWLTDLLLCPDLNPGQTALESESPLVGAVVGLAQVRHDRVEGPHVHKVEQLREQLDRQGSVYAALSATQQQIKCREIAGNVQDPNCYWVRAVDSETADVKRNNLTRIRENE